MPGRLQRVAMEPHVTNDITRLVCSKSCVCGKREVMKPKFGFFVARANMNMWGLAPFIGIEEGPIATPAQDRRRIIS
jgi:hypothetical protein